MIKNNTNSALFKKPFLETICYERYFAYLLDKYGDSRRIPLADLRAACARLISLNKDESKIFIKDFVGYYALDFNRLGLLIPSEVAKKC